MNNEPLVFDIAYCKYYITTIKKRGGNTLRYLFALLLSLPLWLFSQLRTSGELMIELDNYGSLWNVTFVATSLGETWDDDYKLTSDYDEASVLLYGWDVGFPTIPTAKFDLVVDPIAGVNPVMGVGRYKIEAIEGGTVQAVFYMDWTTSDYGPSPDVWFIYDIANTQIIDGTTQTVWDLVSGIDHITSGLELYTSISNRRTHPYVSWIPYQSAVNGYFIHKKLTVTGGATSTSQHYSTTTNWTDLDFTLGNPMFSDDEVEYWISADLSGGNQSLSGNHVNGSGTSFIQWKKVANVVENPASFMLEQNFPNPFNPKTIIRYSIPEDDHVKICVYDLYGRKVKSLVNQTMSAGHHQVEFSAQNVPSGEYIYTIKSGAFSGVKKMILVK